MANPCWKDSGGSCVTSKKLTFRGISFCFLLATLLSFNAAAAEKDVFTKVIQPAMKQHCAKCHGAEGKLEGDVNLLALGEVADLTKDSELIRQLIDVLDLEEMPPEEEPQLDPKLRQQLVGEARCLQQDEDYGQDDQECVGEHSS